MIPDPNGQSYHFTNKYPHLSPYLELKDERHSWNCSESICLILKTPRKNADVLMIKALNI